MSNTIRGTVESATEKHIESVIGKHLLDRDRNEEFTNSDLRVVLVALVAQNIKLKEAIAEVALLQSPDFSGLIKDIKALENQISELDKYVDSLHDKINDLKEAVNDDYNGMLDKISDLGTDLESAQSDIGELSDKLDEVSTDLYLLGPKDDKG